MEGVHKKKKGIRVYSPFEILTDFNMLFPLEHYERIAADYDDSFKYQHAGTIGVLFRNVTFDPEDRILDIGGGSGEIAHRIWEKAGLKNPIVCVDPSKEMLELAKQREGVSPILSGAMEYFLSNPSPPDVPYNKITLFHCIHHFKEDLTVVFSGVKDYLPENGVCVVFQHLQGLSVPFFEAIKQPVKYVQLNQLCGKILDDLGLKWKWLTDSVYLPVQMFGWYDAIRSRYLTYLETLSDAKLEEGISLLKQKYGDKEIVEMEFKFQIIIITK